LIRETGIQRDSSELLQRSVYRESAHFGGMFPPEVPISVMVWLYFSPATLLASRNDLAVLIGRNQVIKILLSSLGSVLARAIMN
jgi:hypothetical protein